MTALRAYRARLLIGLLLLAALGCSSSYTKLTDASADASQPVDQTSPTDQLSPKDQTAPSDQTLPQDQSVDAGPAEIPFTIQQGKTAINELGNTISAPMIVFDVLAFFTNNATVGSVVAPISTKPLVVSEYCSADPKPELGSCPTVSLNCSNDNAAITGIQLDFGGGKAACGCTLHGHAYEGTLIATRTGNDWTTFLVTFENVKRDDVTLAGTLTLAFSYDTENQFTTFQIWTAESQSLKVTRQTETTTLTFPQTPTPTQVTTDPNVEPKRRAVNVNIVSSSNNTLFSTARRVHSTLIDGTLRPLIFEHDGSCIGPRQGALTVAATANSSEAPGKQAQLIFSVAFGYSESNAPQGYRCYKLSDPGQGPLQLPQQAKWCSQPCVAVKLQFPFSAKVDTSAFLAALEGEAEILRDQIGKTYLQAGNLPLSKEALLTTLDDRVKSLQAAISQLATQTEIGDIVGNALKPKSSCTTSVTPSDCKLPENACAPGSLCLCSQVVENGSCVSTGCVTLDAVANACFRWRAVCQEDADNNLHVVSAAVVFHGNGCATPTAGVTYFGQVILTRLSALNPAQGKRKAQLEFGSLKATSPFGSGVKAVTITGVALGEVVGTNKFSLTTTAPGLTILREVIEGGQIKSACSKRLTIGALVYELVTQQPITQQITLDLTAETETGTTAVKTVDWTSPASVKPISYKSPADCLCPYGALQLTYPELQGFTNVTLRVNYQPHTPDPNANKPYCADPQVRFVSPAPQSLGSCKDKGNAGAKTAYCKKLLCEACQALSPQGCLAEPNCTGACAIQSCGSFVGNQNTLLPPYAFCVPRGDDEICLNVEQSAVLLGIEAVEQGIVEGLKAICLPPK